MYLKPEKVTPFGRKLLLSAIIGLTSPPPPPPNCGGEFTSSMFLGVALYNCAVDVDGTVSKRIMQVQSSCHFLSSSVLPLTTEGDTPYCTLCFQIHSVCPLNFAQVVVFTCSRECAFLPGAVENNNLCKIWGAKQSVSWGIRK